jgi:hypothetical protein
MRLSVRKTNRKVMEGITLNIGSPNPINMLIETNDCVFIVSRRAPFGAALARLYRIIGT